MKKILLALFSLASVVLFASDSRSIFAGTPWERREKIARKLYGDIQIVDEWEDYKVRIVDSFHDLRAGDLKVKIVDSPLHRYGCWRIVDKWGDYKIRIVDEHEDVRVQFVDFFPSLPND